MKQVDPRGSRASQPFLLKWWPLSSVRDSCLKRWGREATEEDIAMGPLVSTLPSTDKCIHKYTCAQTPIHYTNRHMWELIVIMKEILNQGKNWTNSLCVWVYVSLCAHMLVCAHCMGAFGGHERVSDPCSWSPRKLWAAQWMRGGLGWRAELWPLQV